MHEKTKATAARRLWAQLPAVILCLSIFLAILFMDGGAMAYMGAGKAERDRKKQEFLTDRTLLSLQLAKCRRYKTSANDAAICGGSSMIYTTLASSGDCLLAEEAAKELGIQFRDLSIRLSPRPGTASKF